MKTSCVLKTKYKISNALMLGVIILLSVAFASATTILDCKNSGIKNCVVDTNSTVNSSDSPFYFDNITINANVIITVNPDSMCGDKGQDGRVAGGEGGGCFSLSARKINLNGKIHANGDDGRDYGDYATAGGGGSGGTIKISSLILNGKGNLIANGGKGGGCVYLDGGAGTAGSIQVYTLINNFSGNIWATGSTATNQVICGYNGPGGTGCGNGASSDWLRSVYISALDRGQLSLTEKASNNSINGHLHLIGTHPDGLVDKASNITYWDLSIMVRDTDYIPVTGIVKVFSENNLVSPIINSNLDSFGVLNSLSFRFNESNDYRINLINTPINGYVVFSGYGSNHYTPTHIKLRSAGSSPSIKLRKLYLTIYDPSHNPAPNEFVYVKDKNGDTVGIGQTNSSGMLYFWLPQYDIDVATTRLKYTVEVPTSLYQNNFTFHNVTVPQHLAIGSNSSHTLATKDIASEMKVGQDYNAEIIFTPDQSMHDLNFVEELPEGFSIRGDVTLLMGNLSGTFSCSITPGTRGFAINSTNCNLLEETRVFGPGNWFRATYAVKAPSSAQIPGTNRTYHLANAGVYATLL